MASSPEINSWNERWRVSPQYAQILTRVGANPAQPRLSDGQRKAVQRAVEREMNIRFPKGVEIDPAGNMNENEGFGKQAKRWGPLIAAGAVSMFGIPGLFPGLLNASGAAGASAAAAPGATGAGTAVGAGAPAAVGAGAGAGTAAAVGAGTTAAGTIAGRNWLDPLLRYGAPIAGQLIGTGMMASADRDAARIQADYLNRALAAEIEERNYRRAFDEEARGYNRAFVEEERGYGRGQRADYLGRLNPYSTAGSEAVGRASGLLTSGFGGGGRVTGTGPMVRLRAPTNEVAEVPASQAEEYIRRGAVRI